MRLSRFQFSMIPIVAVMVIIATYIITNQMGMDMTSLKKIISYLNIITLSALGITFLAGVLLFFFQDKLSDIQDKEIAQSKERSVSAMALAEESRAKQREAELKTKEVELELARMSSTVKETQEKADNASKKAEETKKDVAGRTIDPKKFAERLTKRRGITVDIAAIPNPEAQQLAGLLQKAFRLLGWGLNSVSMNESRTVFGNGGVITQEGVILHGQDSELLNAVKTSLEEQGIKCAVEAGATKGGTIEMYVAGKPAKK